MKKLRLGLVLLLVLGVLTLSGIAWYIQSESFRLRVEGGLKSRIESSTGLACRIEGFRIDVFAGRFEIRELRLEPPPGPARTLQLEIGRIQGRFSWRAFWRPGITLEDLVLHRPRLTLEFLRDHRMVDPESVVRAVQGSLELGARRFAVREGWIDLRNRRIPLDMTLDDFACDVRFRSQPAAYLVRLAYRNAEVAWAGRSMSYDLDAQLELDIHGLSIGRFEARRGQSVLQGEGWMRDWRDPVLLLHAAGRASATELSIFDPHFSAVRGDIHLSGNFRWDAEGFRSDGKFSVEPGSYKGVVAEWLRGNFEMEGRRFHLREVEAKVGQGRFQGEGSFHLGSGGDRPNHLRFTAQDFSLARAARILDLQDLDFENRVDAVCELRWSRGLADLEFEGSATLERETEAGDGADGKKLGLQGEAEFRYVRGTWFVPSALLHSPDTRIEASGDKGNRVHLRLTTGRLEEVLGIARRFSRELHTLLESYPDLMNAPGSYRLEGDVAFRPPAIAFEGKIVLERAAWRSFAADSLSAGLSWDGERLEMRSLEARRGKERAAGALTVALHRGVDEAPDLSFRGVLESVSLRSVGSLGIEIRGNPEGSLSGKGSASRTLGSWSASGDFRIESGKLYEEPFDAMTGHVELRNGELELVKGEARRGEARLGVSGTIALESETLDLVVSMRDLDVRKIPYGADRLKDFGGTVTALARVRGTFDDPAISGSFDLSGLRYDTWALGEGKGILELRKKILEVKGGIRSGLGSMDGWARISTEDGYPGTARLEFKDWNLQKVIQAEIPAYLKDLSTALEGTLDLEGPFSEPEELSARGEMDGARFKINDYELRNSGKIRFSLADEEIRVEECKLVGDGSDLALQGSVPLREDRTLNLRLDGVLNLKAVRTPAAGVALSGTTALDVRATGSVKNPQIIGRADLRDSRLDFSGFPYPVSSLEGRLSFSSYSVRLEGLRGRLASGNVQVGGTLEHQNAEIRSMNLQILARGTRLPYPKDFQSTLDADLALRGTQETQILTGSIHVTRAEYVREFSLLEQLASRTAVPAGPMVSDPALTGLRLDVTIRSEEGLVIDNELLRLRGRINLNLRGTPAYPSLTGRVEATEGSIFFRGNRFDIVRASADFTDRNRINPVFEVRAEADVRSYRLLLDVSGDMDKLQSNIRSDPPMATVDIVTLLATGRAREQTQDSRRQAEITGLSAASILSESLTGVIGKRVQRFFGLESFRVDPFLAGVQNDPTARVTISERLSKELTITFSRNLSTDEEQIVVVEYDVNRNFSIIATRDEDGKFALDFRFRKRFR